MLLEILLFRTKECVCVNITDYDVAMAMDEPAADIWTDLHEVSDDDTDAEFSDFDESESENWQSEDEDIEMMSYENGHTSSDSKNAIDMV